MSQARRRAFLGLHWKGFCWISLLLVALSGVFYALDYRHLMAQFREQRESEVAASGRQIDGLLSRSADRLVRLSGALASLTNLGEVLRTQDLRRTSKLFGAVGYSDLGYELDVQRIDLYTQDAKFVWRWAQADAPLPLDAWALDYIDRVRREDRPLTVLACQPTCLLHAFVPVLSEGQNVGVIAVSQLLADFIVEFRSVAETDVALVMPARASSGAELPGWGAKIAALTNAGTLSLLMRELSQRYPGPQALIPGRLIEWQSQVYDVHAVPLDDMIQAQGGYLVLIANVTQRLDRIRGAFRQELYITGAALAGAELLLAYLVGVPLRRLERFAQALPLLARGAYSDARARFSERRRPFRLRDEIDSLCDDAVALSNRLEHNTRELAGKNRELAVERDFIRGLLASAQVLVVTQTRGGVIRSANEFAARMVGCAPEDLPGGRFADLIGESGSRAEVERRLQALCEGRQKSWEHEHPLRGAGGSSHHIAWVHTPLAEEHPDGTALLSVGMDVTQRIEAEARVRWLASHDPLTGLLNRARFQEELNRIVNESSRAQAGAALFQLDVDFFKEINDSCGHAAGDEALRIVAEEIGGRARKTDIVARLGGDEFAVLMPGTDRYGAESFARELNEKVRNRPFVHGGRQYRLGVSIGIALLPQHGADAQKLMVHADMAMFEAKRAGRSRYWVFAYEQEQEAALSQAIYWKDAFATALDEGRLFFHYQPVFDLATGRRRFHEALLRLRMPDGRIALPAEFLPHAQRSGFSAAVDAYVARAALVALTTDESIETLSINLSAAALREASWAEPLVEAARSRRLDPARLIFEIAETAAIDDLDKARRIAEDLARLGFRFAVDDFGAGFGSLYYLKQLPVALVKIDRSLVRNLVADAAERSFVQAIVTMVHAYGKVSVAEGIEDADTLSLLEAMGVRLAQGHYLDQRALAPAAAPPSGGTRRAADADPLADFHAHRQGASAD
jgi:diguanylate cyclase (GGDEF)-like protein/PAS domain S-box-containing protein